MVMPTEYSRISIKWDLYTKEIYIVADDNEWLFIDAPEYLQRLCAKFRDDFRASVSRKIKYKDIRNDEPIIKGKFGHGG